MRYVSSISGSLRFKCSSDSPQGRRYTRLRTAANHRKAFDWRRFFYELERACGKRNNYAAFAETARSSASEPAVAMTDEEERTLREQLARLLQEHRDLDVAIEALVISPGSDLIQVQRLKKRKLILRDKIRRIEDQLTPDIIA